MRLAIEEGKKGAGFVSPNPLVGCVILDRGDKLLGKGFHARVGENHAEINALAEIEDPNRLDGAHVYVTLEPCAHEGRTPSCAKILAKLPIASVTYGVEDPNPLVSGQGAGILREAGKAVKRESFGLDRELEELAEIFLLNMRDKRPFIAVKIASSLDGKAALKDGTSQWITGEESRARVQYLRGCYDAVVTGLGTFLRDDPRLNSRDRKFENKRQRAVLLDPEGKSFAKLKGSKLLSVRAPEDVIVVTRPLGLKSPSGKHIEVPDAGGAFDLYSLLPALQAEGIHSLFVEGGPVTASRCLLSKMSDRRYVVMAP
jgi:diaminohydroxyphosphoribosylaminopyrimidine deaminase/5-amino-6-(5-phosphoribosylamino)uracil reductase